VQCYQYTVKTVATQHENGQDAQGLKKFDEGNMVPDQRDVQTTASKEYVTYVSYTIRTHLQVIVSRMHYSNYSNGQTKITALIL